MKFVFLNVFIEDKFLHVVEDGFFNLGMQILVWFVNL